jgi:hypothetical protein
MPTADARSPPKKEGRSVGGFLPCFIFILFLCHGTLSAFQKPGGLLACVFRRYAPKTFSFANTASPFHATPCRKCLLSTTSPLLEATALHQNKLGVLRARKNSRLR